MGGTLSKSGGYYSEKEMMNLKEKVKLLQEEVKGMMGEREKEKRNYEREIMAFTFKEADWKQERKKMKEEVMQLKKMVEEKEKIKEMKELGMVERRVLNCGCGRACECGCVVVNADVDGEKEWELMGTKLLVEKMKEERARRDEAVEKWKELYLSIKTELDDLIQRTYDGEGLYWKAEENGNHVENMKRELLDKERAIKTLKAQLDSVKHEKIKKEREFDLLRQSLRIMNGKKNTIQTKENVMKSKDGR